MPIWIIRWARDEPRACASVLATTKSTPDRPDAIILLIALPPAPPTPHTTMRGFSSFSWGAFRLIGIPCLTCWALAGAALPAVDWPVSDRFFESSGRTCPACLLDPSLRQPGDFTSMVNAGLTGMKPLSRRDPNALSYGKSAG